MRIIEYPYLLENELGFKIEKKVKLEDFAKYNLNEYNKIINPIKRDPVKDYIFYHYFHRHPEISMENGISTSFLRNGIDTGWRFGRFYLGVFRLIGNVRRRYNFYKLPIEIYVSYLAKWLGKIVRKSLNYLHIRKSKRSEIKNYSGLVELEPTRT